MLLTAPITGCCTGRIIYGFGHSYVASNGPIRGFPVEDIKKELAELEGVYSRMGMAVVVITLNSDQTTEDKVLRDAGYSHSRWISKKQHPETKLRVYYKPLDQLNKGA